MKIITFITPAQERHTCPEDHLDILALEKYKQADNGTYVPGPDLENYEAGKWPLAIVGGI